MVDPTVPARSRGGHGATPLSWRDAAIMARSLLVGRLTLLLLATVVALLGAEGTFRFGRGRGLLASVQPLRAESDPDLGWRYAAGQRVRHRTAEFAVEVRLDDRGDRVGPRQPGAGPLAVFVGDSLTFGWGVAAEDAFAFRVGRDLGMRVRNLGVPGHGPDQAYLRLRRDGLPLRPVLVVLTLAGNDLVDARRRRAYGRSKPTFVLHRGELRLQPPLPAPWLATHSELVRAVAGRLQERLERRRGTPAAAPQLVAGIVRAAATAAQRDGARFVLVRSGEPWQRGIGNDLAGARVVDLAAPLSAPGVRFADGHWNREGHRRAACAIARAVLDAGWASGCAGSCAR